MRKVIIKTKVVMQIRLFTTYDYFSCFRIIDFKKYSNEMYEEI